MKDTVRKGNLTDLKARAKLYELGFDVFVPVGDGNKVDLLIMRDDVISRVQVKTSRLYRNSWIFNNYSTTRIRSKGSKPRLVYTKEHIDFIATFRHDEFFLIPIESINVQEPRLHNFSQYIQ